MKQLFQAIFCTVAFGLLMSSCKKDETTTDPNQSVVANLTGTWVTTKTTENGVDISLSTSTTLVFKSGQKLEVSSTEQGFIIEGTGTFLVKDDGKALEMDTDVAGIQDYKINSSAATTMQLEKNLGLVTRVFDFKKQ